MSRNEIERLVESILDPRDDEVTTDEPGGRVSRCRYRHRKTEVRNGRTFGQGFNGRQPLWGTVPAVCPSRPDLPFFRAKPDDAFDEHYCGCHGWD